MKNINEIDILDEKIDNLPLDVQDNLLKRVKYELGLIKHLNPPCECPWCQNWISETDLFWRIGNHNETVICLDCAKPIIERLERESNETDT